MMSYVCLCAVDRSTLWVFCQGTSKKSVEANPKEPQDPEGAIEPVSLSVCVRYWPKVEFNDFIRFFVCS